MKKLILSSLFLLGSLCVGTTMAQTRQDRPRVWRDEHPRERIFRDHRRFNDTYVVTEYRYVRQGRDVYKETYRSTYTQNGFLVNRDLVDRKRIKDKGRFRFNVFLRF